MSTVAETGIWRFALVGTPNSGKTALFNALTGSRQKVANYAGVTVEKKTGVLQTAAGRSIDLIDLPGTYSLRGRSPDEEITRDVVLGRIASETAPDFLLCVADATNLRVALRLVIELKRTGRPLLLVLNMIDIARRRGIDIDLGKLSVELGVPVVTSTAVRRGGTEELLRRIDEIVALAPARRESTWQPPGTSELRAAQREADRVIKAAVGEPRRPDTVTGRVDAVLLHPVAGLLILLCILFVMFQAVFAWAKPLMELIAGSFEWLGALAAATSARGPPAKLHPERRDRRCRQRRRVPAADRDPVPVHPAAGGSRLHGARGVPDGPHHGRCRIARPRVHSAAVELRLRDPRHHGDARDRQPARPAHHHPGRAADDVLGAHSGLYADHLGVHPGPGGLGLHRPAGPGDVRPLRRRHRQRARSCRSSPIASSGARARRRRSCWNCRTTSCRGRAAS